MRSVAVCGKLVEGLARLDSHFEQIELDGVPITCALLQTEAPNFDGRANGNESQVLVNTKAFSCNYRDKKLIFAALQNGAAQSYYVIGSEFVGEVVAVGSEVVDLAVGDRVIGNNWYLGMLTRTNELREGVTTNHASKEFQVIHQSKLIRIPSQMPDTIAASFSLNSQSAYSMLRKLDLKPRSRILLTAAKSNVSLFVLNALRKYDVDIFVTSTSFSFEQRLKELGVTGIIKVSNNANGSVNQRSLHEGASRVGPFDSVVDPFFDLHFNSAIRLMAPGGRYITCGFVGLKPSNGEPEPHTEVTTTEALEFAVLRNLQFIGNCLGSTEDLKNAIQDFTEGSYNVIVDSVHRGDQIASFFNRTYSARDRFGKVVYVFD